MPVGYSMSAGFLKWAFSGFSRCEAQLLLKLQVLTLWSSWETQYKAVETGWWWDE